MKKQWKICKNKDCRKKFYRIDNIPDGQWNRREFHNQNCQREWYNSRRRESRKYKIHNPMNFKALNDACNRYSVKARNRLMKQVKIYSCKDMTQEELRSLVPSIRS